MKTRADYIAALFSAACLIAGFAILASVSP